MGYVPNAPFYLFNYIPLYLSELAHKLFHSFAGSLLNLDNIAIRRMNGFRIDEPDWNIMRYILQQTCSRIDIERSAYDHNNLCGRHNLGSAAQIRHIFSEEDDMRT